MFDQPKPTTYSDAFVDFAWKRLFASEESKPTVNTARNEERAKAEAALAKAEQKAENKKKRNGFGVEK